MTGFTREHIQGISETKMDEWNKLCLKHFGLPLMVLNNTQIINALCEEWTDIVKYNNPVLAKSASGLIDLIRQADSPFDKTLQIHFNRSEQDEICLLYQFTDNLFLSYNFDSDFNKDTFENALIESDILLKQFFENAASYKKPTYPVLRLSSIKFMGKPPDKNSENETYSISRDIREHIRKLQLNVSANNKVALILKMAQELIKTHANEEQYFDLLESLSKMIRYVDAPVETSRMYISNDYKILLTDFDIEIKMQPLHKAVYILFYHHPEGILLANLDQHREELTNIYGAVSNRRDPEIIEKTISELLNPASNTINECLSRIREAFLKVIDERIARLYYISGERGGVKRIVENK